MNKTIIITGGAGFIGSALIRRILATESSYKIVNVDCLTYAGNLESLASVENHQSYNFEKVNICDASSIEKVFEKYTPDGVIHLAAESHVDRSIDGPAAFIHTNIIGTYTLLEASRKYWSGLTGEKKNSFRFHHVSTDEVFGSLGSTGFFTESTAYDPRSPYSSSKASSDMLVRAWHHTYELPIVLTNCSNNYGPFQFPEKLIPLMILNGAEGKKLPVYGNGDNIRDWLHVDDHAKALMMVFEKGQAGQTYNVGGRNERTNLQVVETICDILDELDPLSRYKSRRELITFVKDRPGHDRRYAIDASKIENELGWKASYNFNTGIRATVEWYLDNKSGWCERVLSGKYQRERLGTL